MGGENLNITPRKTHQIRLEFECGIADGLCALRFRKQRQVENALPYFGFPAVDKVCQIGHTNRVDFFAREENVENRIHQLSALSS